MDYSQFDSDIQNLEKRMENIRKDLEKYRGEFIKSTKDFIAKWIQGKVKGTIISKPGLAKKIEKEGLGKIKVELHALIQKIPNIVEEHLNKNEHWAHCKEFCKPEDFDSYNISSIVKDRIRELLGYAGEILIKHKFADTGYHSEWEYGEDRPKFGYGFDISGEMDGILGGYVGLYHKFESVNNEINEIKRKKAEAEVEELWKKS